MIKNIIKMAINVAGIKFLAIFADDKRI